MDERNDNQILFEEVLNVWLEDVRQTHAISTYVKYTRIVKKHIQPYFKDVPLTQITPASLRQFSDDLKQLAQKSKENKEAADKVWGEKKADFSMGDVYSHTMIQTAVMITNMTMKMAFRRGLVHEWNAVPCSRRKKRALVQVLSTEEQMKLEGYIKENWSQTGFGIYLCLYTGMRLGEICALKWENINIREGYLIVSSTVQRLSIEQENGNNKSMLFVRTSQPEKLQKELKKSREFPQFLLFGKTETGEDELIPISTQDLTFLQNVCGNELQSDMGVTDITLGENRTILGACGALERYVNQIVRLDLHKRFAVVAVPLFNHSQTVQFGIRLEQDRDIVA